MISGGRMNLEWRKLGCEESEFITYYGIWEFQFQKENMFDSLSWSSVVRDFYTRRGFIIGELNKEQQQAWQVLKKKG